MTQNEINDKLKLAQFPNWFKKIEANFNFPHLNLSIQKEGFLSIYQYVARQNRGWSKFDEELPKQINSSLSFFQILQTRLDEFLINYIDDSEASLQSNWSIRINGIIVQVDRDKIFTYDSPITSFLLGVNEEGLNQFEGAYDYLITAINNSKTRNSDYFSGTIKAYEFRFQESSNISKRRNLEKSSNNLLRNNFENFFSTTEKRTSNFYNELDEKSNKLDERFNGMFSKNQKSYDLWLETVEKKESDYNAHSLKRVKELENLYSEKLMLEKPADYWNERAEKLKEEAKNWLWALIISTGVAVIILIIVLAFISDGTLASLFSKTGLAIRWSIVFVTLISFLAFCIRTFAKLSFSSYHLVRDAEERKQLVYVYLALKQEKAIKDEERILILQSIFSRSDSGLLKDNSSPTMPSSNGLIDKLFK